MREFWLCFVSLFVGPAVLTTTLVLMGEHGAQMTVLAVTANTAITGVVFWLSERIHRCLGKAGSKRLSKAASLLLAGAGGGPVSQRGDSTLLPSLCRLCGRS
ncbi:MAG: MarC family protein [Planctomycetota bacterium]